MTFKRLYILCVGTEKNCLPRDEFNRDLAPWRISFRQVICISQNKFGAVRFKLIQDVNRLSHKHTAILSLFQRRVRKIH